MITKAGWYVGIDYRTAKGLGYGMITVAEGDAKSADEAAKKAVALLRKQRKEAKLETMQDVKCKVTHAIPRQSGQ